jgi:hypothetical protein
MEERRSCAPRASEVDWRSNRAASEKWQSAKGQRRYVKREAVGSGDGPGHRRLASGDLQPAGPGAIAGDEQGIAMVRKISRLTTPQCWTAAVAAPSNSG